MKIAEQPYVVRRHALGHSLARVRQAFDTFPEFDEEDSVAAGIFYDIKAIQNRLTKLIGEDEGAHL